MAQQNKSLLGLGAIEAECRIRAFSFDVWIEPANFGRD